MPFKGGLAEVKFARSANMDHEKVQRAMDEFQLAIAVAVINLGNLGCDPATIGGLLKNAGEGIIYEGYAVMAQAFTDQPHGEEYVPRLPPLVEEFAKLGGNPPRGMPVGFGDDLLAELGLRPRRAIDIN
jgi:hypothetical protein